MVSDVAQIMEEERDEHPGRQVVRRTVDGGAAEARADALGGERDAARGPQPSGTTARASIRRVPAEQHKAFAELVAASGAALEWLPDADDGLRIRSSHTTRR